MMYKYSPKRAAMVILDAWLSSGSRSPWFMDTDDMMEACHQYGWKITEKRREAIIVHVDKIIGPLKERIAGFIERMWM